MEIYKRKYTNGLLMFSVLFFMIANVIDGLFYWKDVVLVLTIPVTIWYFLCKFVFKKLR